MAAPPRSRKFQSPRGTRDFYPADLAVRRHIENVWREVSINHGFEEIDGPTFEHLDMYTHKSGPGIVSELFSFRRQGGKDDYALRPEFTPTLARMVAARAAELPRPIKWFSIGPMFRAERPQRGRLREHIQWNVDIIGDDSPQADAEIIAVAIDSLCALGIDPIDFFLFINHRKRARDAIQDYLYVTPQDVSKVMEVLDRRAKLSHESFLEQLGKFDITEKHLSLYDEYTASAMPLRHFLNATRDSHEFSAEVDPLAGVTHMLSALDEKYIPNCYIDDSIVRGLAYYTGTVFEIHEKSGKERAIAGGGRYDNLIESFGGPKLPACGFGMGDVVLSLVLEDHGLLKPAEDYLPRPDVFVISTGDDKTDEELPKLISQLRRDGFHARQSYKTTRNVGKLLSDASKARAKFAVILGKELQAGNVVLKNLDSGEQKEVPLDEISSAIKS